MYGVQLFVQNPALLLTPTLQASSDRYIRSITMDIEGRPSTLPTTNYPSSHFLESSGAIPFILSQRKIVLISRTRHRETEYFLAKGRRNIGESRLANALRETREETGYTCLPLPVPLDTRLCPAEEVLGVFTPDKVRVYADAVEPFMVSVRDITRQGQMEGDLQVKVIWFFVARVDESQEAAVVNDSEVGGVEAFGYEEAVKKCTFEKDREVLRRAIELVERSQSA